MDEITEALKLARIEIKKYDEKLLKPIRTLKGNFAPGDFAIYLQKELGKDLLKFPTLHVAIFDAREFDDMVVAHAKKAGVWQGAKIAADIPAEHASYILNMDLTSQETKFFVTTKDDIVVQAVSGNSYIKMHGLKEPEAVAMSRMVVPEYQPRGKPGVVFRQCKDKTKQNVLNTYIPPTWTRYQQWGKLPDELPDVVEQFFAHFFPLEIERKYFFAWLYESMFERSYVYLVLNGLPGSGKNRLKNIMTALHGHSNSVDGKASTLTERFNGQLEDCTLMWFDEHKTTVEMESRLKELQNDTVPIEKKGVDSTRSTEIFASFVISNNDPRHNYTDFGGRKFVPLVIADKDLKDVMPEDEIEEMSNKLNERHPDFDVKFVAQIAKWVKLHGRSKKWPRLEYKGPMFWRLARATMFAWQKAVVHALHTLPPGGGRLVLDDKRGILFSSVHTSVLRKTRGRPIDIPDYELIRPFLNIYRNLKGEKVFKTTQAPGELGDFWVKILNDEPDDL